MRKPVEHPYVWYWKGKVLATIGDVDKAVMKIKTRDDARKFINGYVKSTPNLKKTVILSDIKDAIMVGTKSSEDRKRLLNLFFSSAPSEARRL